MGTISLTTSRTGSGATSTIVIKSGDTSVAPSWVAGPFKPTSQSDLEAAKSAIWNEICRQMAAL